MKVAILLFLSLSLLEPMESHGLHAWTFMNLKNNFGQRQQPKDSKDGFAVGTSDPTKPWFLFRFRRNFWVSVSTKTQIQPKPKPKLSLFFSLLYSLTWILVLSAKTQKRSHTKYFFLFSITYFLPCRLTSRENLPIVDFQY